MARNVLLIMVDQWRWDLSPGLGNPLVATPALDRPRFQAAHGEYPDGHVAGEINRGIRAFALAR